MYNGLTVSQIPEPSTREAIHMKGGGDQPHNEDAAPSPVTVEYV